MYCFSESCLFVGGVFFSVYKKHYPPALHDEVWRLNRIAKDGALHKKLLKSNIGTVEDFLRILVKDPQKLRSVCASLICEHLHKKLFLDLYPWCVFAVTWEWNVK